MNLQLQKTHVAVFDLLMSVLKSFICPKIGEHGFSEIFEGKSSSSSKHNKSRSLCVTTKGAVCHLRAGDSLTDFIA